MADEKIITSSVFEQSVTEIMQDVANNLYEFEEYTEEEVANLIDLSEEEVAELTRVINDTTVALNKVYSNKKVEEATVLAKLNGADPVGFVVGAYVELVPEETVQESIYLPRTEIPEMDFETEDIDFENL